MTDKKLSHLDELEAKSIFIIREAYSKFKDLSMLWSIGKDSTVLLWLCRKAFFGKIPFPVLHIDTSYKFKEIYEFRDKYAKEWKLKLLVSKNEDAINNNMNPKNGAFECCSALKTKALKDAIDKYKFKALLLGIRRDEHGIRAKERYFSPRNTDFKWDYKNQPPELWNNYKSQSQNEEHLRIHPLLHWREIDMWEYVKRENIPMVDLYFAKPFPDRENKMMRYRSIGCAPCCKPVESEADTVDKIIEELKTTKTAERSGRSQDKEKTFMMQRLRAMGYM